MDSMSASAMSAGDGGGLPPPDGDGRRHSQRVRDRIAAEIAAAGGAIDFDRYMELALYEPRLGYYVAGPAVFGAGGDFVTAPELGSLFGLTLARQCAEVLEETGGDVLEVGAGTGALAADLLGALERAGRLPNRYRILEPGAALRERQRQTLSARVPHLVSRVKWLDGLPGHPVRGVVVANELLDAMPVTVFETGSGQAWVLQVGCGGGRLRWCRRPADPVRDAAVCAIASGLESGYRSEVNERASAWVTTVAALLEAGTLLVVDYGFPQREYYHPDRRTGTLMCHYRHRAHSDPFVWPGLQDITAHVDFSAIARTGREAGLTVSGFTQLASFLTGLGILDLVDSSDGVAPAAARELKLLLLPSEMGELFKVLALSRGVDRALNGFATGDRSLAL
jgi:SAM-dependent MidA family methyltransferase